MASARGRSSRALSDAARGRGRTAHGDSAGPPDTRRLSRGAALNCTSRLALRVALASTGLNPEWWPYLYDPLLSGVGRVIKAPASCANNGIRALLPTEHTALLESVAPELARFGVVERYVEGPQFEMDGFVIGGRVHFFHPILQRWNDAGDRIVAYEREEPDKHQPGFREAVEMAVKAVGLDDAPFCAELRITAEGWKLIEIHARLGEDLGLSELMWDTSPLEEIERVCSASVGGSRVPEEELRPAAV